jgi:hypothetical protein
VVGLFSSRPSTLRSKESIVHRSSVSFDKWVESSGGIRDASDIVVVDITGRDERFL